MDSTITMKEPPLRYIFIVAQTPSVKPTQWRAPNDRHHCLHHSRPSFVAMYWVAVTPHDFAPPWPPPSASCHSETTAILNGCRSCDIVLFRNPRRVSNSLAGFALPCNPIQGSTPRHKVFAKAAISGYLCLGGLTPLRPKSQIVPSLYIKLWYLWHSVSPTKTFTMTSNASKKTLTYAGL